jgi:hypothetical protein
MSARTLARRLTAVAALPVEQPPARIVRRGEVRGWAFCDVCGWPVVPAATVPGRKPRHPGCVCFLCDAPLLPEQLQPGVIWHPQCRPTTTARPVLTVIGGAR